VEEAISEIIQIKLPSMVEWSRRAERIDGEVEALRDVSAGLSLSKPRPQDCNLQSVESSLWSRYERDEQSLYSTNELLLNSTSEVW
jgi:hypothetical protein